MIQPDPPRRITATANPQANRPTPTRETAAFHALYSGPGGEVSRRLGQPLRSADLIEAAKDFKSSHPLLADEPRIEFREICRLVRRHLRDHFAPHRREAVVDEFH